MKKILQTLLIVFLIFCVLFTGFSLSLVVKHPAQAANFIQSLILIDRHFLFPTDTGTMMEGMLSGMVQSLNDRYSRYLNPERYKQFRDSFRGVYGGIGIYADFVDDFLVVVSTMENTPGERAGLQAGDIIVGVDNASVAGKSMSDVIEMIKGEPGTQVTLTIRRGNQELFDVSITREFIDTPTVYTEMLEEAPEFGYLRISVFSQKTYREFVEKMNPLLENDPQGLIIDLRNNPGGELEAVVNVIGSFIPEGPVIHQVDKRGNLRTIVTTGNTLGIPIVILTNGSTASAAEAMTGALQDRAGAFVIGTNTFGKGVVQTIFPLSGGGALEITTNKYLTAGKRDIHEVGIPPDLVVEIPEGEERDLQLEAAIAHLQNVVQ